MSSHFLFHSEASETVPASARYSFPTQASRVVKSVVKIPPRTGTSMQTLGTSAKGRTIQFTMPAQGYWNPLESYLRFDLTFNAGALTLWGLRPVNAIQTMFRRLRISYGSLVIEDIQNYGTLVRMLTNVAVEGDYAKTGGAILEGMGPDALRARLHNPGNKAGILAAGTTPNGTYLDAALSPEERQMVVVTNSTTTPAAAAMSTAALSQENPTVTHTYCVNLASGLLTQQKLIPLKWMANQLTIELELEEPAAFAVHGVTGNVTSQAVATLGAATSFPVVNGQTSHMVPNKYSVYPAGTAPTGAQSTLTYNLDNIYFVSEILEYDSTYDAAFYQGMLQGGVPLKFASWHGHLHVLTGGSQAVLTIQERSRSVKSAFSVIRKRADITPTLMSDPYWFYNGGTGDANSSIDEFQWRIGGRYFPSQPVKCTSGTEPFVELQKALNILGDYSVGSAITAQNWFVPQTGGTFTIAGEFESSNGMEISGVNAEELADLTLIVKAFGNFDNDMQVYTFVHYDSMMIIRPNNVVELVQ